MNFVVFKYYLDDFHQDISLHSYHENTTYENVVKKISETAHSNRGFIIYDLASFKEIEPLPDDWKKSKTFECTFYTKNKIEKFEESVTNIKTHEERSRGCINDVYHYCAVLEVINPLEKAKEKLTENELAFFKKRIKGE